MDVVDILSRRAKALKGHAHASLTIITALAEAAESGNDFFRFFVENLLCNGRVAQSTWDTGREITLAAADRTYNWCGLHHYESAHSAALTSWGALWLRLVSEQFERDAAKLPDETPASQRIVVVNHRWLGALLDHPNAAREVVQDFTSRWRDGLFEIKAGLLRESTKMDLIIPQLSALYPNVDAAGWNLLELIDLAQSRTDSLQAAIGFLSLGKEPEINRNRVWESVRLRLPLWMEGVESIMLKIIEVGELIRSRATQSKIASVARIAVDRAKRWQFQTREAWISPLPEQLERESAQRLDFAVDYSMRDFADDLGHATVEVHDKSPTLAEQPELTPQVWESRWEAVTGWWHLAAQECGNIKLGILQFDRRIGSTFRSPCTVDTVQIREFTNRAVEWSHYIPGTKRIHLESALRPLSADVKLGHNWQRLYVLESPHGLTAAFRAAMINTYEAIKSLNCANLFGELLQKHVNRDSHRVVVSNDAIGWIVDLALLFDIERQRSLPGGSRGDWFSNDRVGESQVTKSIGGAEFIPMMRWALGAMQRRVPHGMLMDHLPIGSVAILSPMNDINPPPISKAKDVSPKPESQVISSEIKGPTISSNPTQIVLDGKAFSLTELQANYLKELIACGDWLSDPQYKKLHPEVGESARPDRWRQKLPLEVLRRIESGGNKGQRWRKLE